jgi:hypothetical protein
VMDGMDKFIESGTQSPMLVAFQLSRILSESHAFEKGDTQEEQWIDGERHDVLRRIDCHEQSPLDTFDYVTYNGRRIFAAFTSRLTLRRGELP